MSVSNNFHFILLVIGLDGSGKTTFIESFKEQAAGASGGIQDKTVLPTASMGIGTMMHQGKKIVYYDMSGDGRHRFQWMNFFGEVHGILFVVDASDEKRTPIVKEHLKMLFKDDILNKRHVPIMIACNKMDIPEVRDKMMLGDDLSIGQLERGQNIRFDIENTSGYEARGMKECLDWLLKKVVVNLNTVKK